MHERTTVRKKTGLRTQMMTLMLILCTLALLIQGCLLIYASVRFYSEKAYDDMEFFLQTCNSNFSSKMLYVEGVVNNLRGDPMMQSFFSDEGFNWVEIRSQFEFCTNIVSERLARAVRVRDLSVQPERKLPAGKQLQSPERRAEGARPVL